MSGTALDSGMQKIAGLAAPNHPYRSEPDLLVDELLASGLPRWMVADPGMIRLLRTRVRPPRTLAGRLVDGYFRLFEFSGPGVLGIRLVSSAIVLHWWLTSARRDPGLGSARHLFLGFGAAIEDALYREFEQEKPDECCRLHSLQHRSLGRLGRPRLWRVLQVIWKQARIAGEQANGCASELVLAHRAEWSSSVAKRLYRLAYFAAWTEQLPEKVETITCIFLDAATAGIAMTAHGDRHRRSLEYWQHGFLSNDLIGPAGLHRVRALNALEGKFLSQRCPGARIDVVAPKLRPRPIGLDAEPFVLLASQYDTTAFHKAHQLVALRHLQAWATEHRLELVLRLHPREDGRFWHEAFPGIRVDGTKDGFAACLERLRPLYVCSWSSTALLDALVAGIVPILLEDDVDRHASDLAFPLAAISVALPGEAALLNAITSRNEDYRRILAEKQRLLGESIDEAPACGEPMVFVGSLS